MRTRPRQGFLREFFKILKDKMRNRYGLAI